MSESALLARLARLCDDLATLADPSSETVLRARLAAVREGLAGPLRLAVVGNVSVGKSTIVNALVRRRVAPTAAGECTRVVTWYVRGRVDSATLHLKDGTRRHLPLVDGALPADVGVPADEVDRLVVSLVAPRLDDLVVIDTPGLESLTASSSAATRGALLGFDRDSRAAAGQADALLFTFREAARGTDLEFLRSFRAASGQRTGEAVNTIGVLTQADRGRGDDPVAAMQQVADRLAAEHVSLMSGVVAVSGLIEQSARTGQVTEAVARTLVQLADVSPVRLRAWTGLQHPDVARDRLVEAGEALTSHGLVAGRDAARGGARGLREWCFQASGFQRLTDLIDGTLVPRSQAIKGSQALTQLRDLAGALADRDAALDLVEEADLDPALHPVQELRTLQRLLAHAPDSGLRRELEVLVDRGPARDELRPRARELSLEARRQAALSLDAHHRAAAQVLARSYHLLGNEPPDPGNNQVPATI